MREGERNRKVVEKIKRLKGRRVLKRKGRKMKMEGNIEKMQGKKI